MNLVVLNCRGTKITVDLETIKHHGFFKIWNSSEMKKENEEIFLDHYHKTVHKLLDYFMGYKVDIEQIKDIAYILSIDIKVDVPKKNILMWIGNCKIEGDLWLKSIKIFQNYNITIDDYIRKYSESFGNCDDELLSLSKQLIIKSYAKNLDLIGNEDINICIVYNKGIYNSQTYIRPDNHKAKLNDNYFYIYKLIRAGKYDITEYDFIIKIKYWEIYNNNDGSKNKLESEFNLYVQKEKIQRLK